jgi:hypothetical protein
MEWLSCRLRETKASTDAVLRYLAAHPGDSAASASALVRELHQVVLTKPVTVEEAFLTGSGQHRQATMYRVTWEMAALQPYAYAPPSTVGITWDSEEVQPVQWVHASECQEYTTCDPMPVLFSADCTPEEVAVVNTPPPACGGCLPVCEVTTRTFVIPTGAAPLLCDETTVTLDIHNGGETPLTLQAYYRVHGTDELCRDNLWPVQVSGLPSAATLTLDGVSGRYWATVDRQRYRAVGIVSAPSGAPWRPPLIDRAEVWELVVLSAGDAQFDVTLTLLDREA